LPLGNDRCKTTMNPMMDLVALPQIAAVQTLKASL